LEKITPEKSANKLLRFWQSYGGDTYPIDLQKIVSGVVNESSGPDHLGLVYKELHSVHGAMVRSRENHNSYSAIVNKKVKNFGRRSFTMAHEIGHFVLHRKLQDEFRCSGSMINDFRVNQLEKEANTFASQLLLPPNRLRSFDESRWSIETLQAIADMFGVSWQAAGLRMTQISSRPIGFVVSISGVVEWGCASKSLFDKGVYFLQLDSVPEHSTAFDSDFTDERLGQETTFVDGWRINDGYRESSLRGYEDRIYTCIDAG
jgi:hypothetical protein